MHLYNLSSFASSSCQSSLHAPHLQQKRRSRPPQPCQAVPACEPPQLRNSLRALNLHVQQQHPWPHQQQQQPGSRQPHPQVEQQQQQQQQQQQMRQQRSPMHLQPPQQPRPPGHPLNSPQRHKQPKRASLAAALHITQQQAHQMLAAYPSLSNYNPSTLATKLQELSAMLDLQPQQLGPALCTAPKVLGLSLQAIERHLGALLLWVQPDKQLLAQMVLEAPLLLTWSHRHLQSRLTRVSSQLGLSPHSLALLLQRHPQLLPASGHLQHTLQLLQQLYLLAAASEQAGFGVGAVADLLVAGQHSMEQHAAQGLASVVPQQQQQQQQQVGVADAAQAAARQLALQHPQLLLVGPEALQAQVAAMQARSGLPAAQVAAMMISQPQLLLPGAMLE